VLRTGGEHDLLLYLGQCNLKCPEALRHLRSALLRIEVRDTGSPELDSRLQFRVVSFDTRFLQDLLKAPCGFSQPPLSRQNSILAFNLLTSALRIINTLVI
jgi:hypothetical protein